MFWLKLNRFVASQTEGLTLLLLFTISLRVSRAWPRAPLGLTTAVLRCRHHQYVIGTMKRALTKKDSAGSSFDDSESGTILGRKKAKGEEAFSPKLQRGGGAPEPEPEEIAINLAAGPDNEVRKALLEHLRQWTHDPADSCEVKSDGEAEEDEASLKKGEFSWDLDEMEPGKFVARLTQSRE
jgi:hypothetical protein